LNLCTSNTRTYTHAHTHTHNHTITHTRVRSINRAVESLPNTADKVHTHTRTWQSGKWTERGEKDTHKYTHTRVGSINRAVESLHFKQGGLETPENENETETDRQTDRERANESSTQRQTRSRVRATHTHTNIRTHSKVGSDGPQVCGLIHNNFLCPRCSLLQTNRERQKRETHIHAHTASETERDTHQMSRRLGKIAQKYMA